MKKGSIKLRKQKPLTILCFGRYFHESRNVELLKAFFHSRFLFYWTKSYFYVKKCIGFTNKVFFSYFCQTRKVPLQNSFPLFGAKLLFGFHEKCKTIWATTNSKIWVIKTSKNKIRTNLGCLFVYSKT